MILRECVLSLVLSIPLLCGQTAPKSQTRLPDAASILDRFVAATGGVEAYRKFAFEKIESTIVLPSGIRIRAISLRSRDGRRETLIGSTAQPTRSGVTNGIAWELEPANGRAASERRCGEGRASPKSWVGYR